MAITSTVTGITTDTGTSNADGVTNDNTLIIAVEAVGAFSVEVFQDGVKIGDAVDQGGNVWTFDHTGTSLNDGTFNFTSIANERVVNAGGLITIVPGPESAPFPVTIDTVAPGTPVTMGAEFVANALTFADQNEPVLATLENCNYVMAYVFDRGAIGDVQVDIRQPDGTFVAGSRVNGRNSDVLDDLAITALEGGGFVVSWKSDEASKDGSGSAVLATIFDANGTIIKGEFVVNALTEDGQDAPALAALPGGGFVATWVTFEPVFSAIQAQIFDATGAVSVAEFLVANQTSSTAPVNPSVIPLSGGVFAVGWLVAGTATPSEAYKTRLFDATGAPLGAEQTITKAVQVFVRNEIELVPFANGGFMAVFRDGEIFAQRFDTSGEKVGGFIQVNTEPTGDQEKQISATLLDDGTVAITWTSDVTGANPEIKGQILSASGEKVGVEFAVNTETTGDQENSSVTALSDGKFVAAWATDDTSQDGDGTAIKAQVFQAPIRTTVESIAEDTGSDGTDGLTNDNTLLFVGESAPDAEVEVFLNGISVGQTTADGNGNWTFDHTGTELPDGQYEVTARQLDLAGNPGATSDPFTATVDTTPPGDLGKSGGEFRANVETTFENQNGPDVTTLANGNVVVVFSSGFSYLAQIFDPSGAAIGDEIDVSPGGTNDLNADAKVAALEGGGFAVITSDVNEPSFSDNTIKAQIFDATGAVVGAEITVATSNTGTFLNIPDLTALPGGGFIAVWEDDQSGDIFARAFDATGTETIAQFQANTTSLPDGQFSPTVIALSGGGFVIGWSGKNGAIELDAFRIFDATGTPLADQQLINNLTDASDSPISMTPLASGGFAVVFEGDLNPGDHSIIVLVYDATGTQVAGPITPNTDVTPAHNNPAITQLSDGNLLVTWETPDASAFGDASGSGIVGRLMTEAGVFVSDEFLVNTQTLLSQNDPEVTPLLNGGAFVAWQTAGDEDIKAQIFHPVTDTTVTVVESHGTANDNLVNGSTFTVEGTAEAGATVDVTIGGILLGGGTDFNETVTVQADGTWSTTVSGLAVEGTRAVNARATDAAGNVETATANQLLTVDLTPLTLGPVDLIDASDTGASSTDDVTTDTTPTISFTAEAGAAIEVDFGDGNGFVAAGNGTGAAQQVTLATAYTTEGVKAIQVRATDAAGNQSTQNLPVTINLPPTAVTLNPAAVVENSANTTVVGALAAVDTTPGDAHAFALLNDAGGLFALNGTNLVVNGALDFEAATGHNVTVRATDAAGSTVDQLISVNVTNAYEAVTAVALASNSVAENAATGTVVGALSATDIDAADTHIFSLINNPGGLFGIAGSNLTVAGALDFETASSHQVTVRATDAGGLSLDQAFAINVTDVNEAPTAIALANFSVVENSASGTVVGAVNVTDPDAGDTHTLSLLNDAGGLFALNGSNLVVNGALDFEAATSHNVTLRATDAGGLSVDQVISVNVTNANEAVTSVALAGNSVVENAATGTVVGALSATDIDAADTHNFSLVNNPGGLFGITGNNLTVTGALDFETASSHQVTVRATDAGGLSLDQAFAINVTNVNEAPTSLTLSKSDVNENVALATVIGALAVDDPDAGDTHTLSLINNAGGLFSLNGNNLVVNGALDFEAAASHQVIVRATDAGGLTRDQAFTISVNNVNESPTAVALALAGDEDTVISGLAVASDPDGDALTFALGVGPSNGTATMAGNGAVSYTPNADFNGTDSFTFTASDGNGGTDTETVSVTVNPVPDTVAVPAGGSVTSSPSNLDGGSVTGLAAGNTISVTTPTPFAFTDITVDAATGTVSIPGATFTVDANLVENNFVVVPNASGGVDIVLVDVLKGDGEDLNEGQAVDPSAINGIVPEAFLSAANSAQFQVTYNKSQGAFDNALGSFVRNADGSVSDVKVLFDATSTTPVGSSQTVDVAPRGTLEFFLIQDFGNSGITLTDDLAFDFSGARPQLTDAGVVQDLEIFHSEATAFNSDGIEHFLSGVIDGGGALRIGIEDLTGGGDMDYQDFVFTVSEV